MGVESGLVVERPWRGPTLTFCPPRGFRVRADTSDVAFRLLLALGELWDGVQRAGVDPSGRGLHLTKEYLGGYTRICAGPGSHPRLIVEWNESSRHLRVLRCDDWPGFEATISATVAIIRAESRSRGLIDVVDAAFMKACQDSAPIRRTVCSMVSPQQQNVVARRH